MSVDNIVTHACCIDSNIVNEDAPTHVWEIVHELIHDLQQIQLDESSCQEAPCDHPLVAQRGFDTKAPCCTYRATPLYTESAASNKPIGKPYFIATRRSTLWSSDS